MTSGAAVFALGTWDLPGRSFKQGFYALQDSKTPMKLALVSTGLTSSSVWCWFAGWA